MKQTVPTLAAKNQIQNLVKEIVNKELDTERAEILQKILQEKNETIMKLEDELRKQIEENKTLKLNLKRTKVVSKNWNY